MSNQASSSSTYRNPTVVDGSDDEDDLDDLDDVLQGFNQRPTAPSASAAPIPSSSRQPGPVAPPLDGDDDDDDGEGFEADLAGEMEQLLRQLAGTHIPGPMPDTADGTSSTGEATRGVKGESGSKLSTEEEEAAFQKAIEMMLSGEGISALGLDGKSPSDPSGAGPSIPKRSSAPRSEGSAAPTSFDETIRRTMEQLGSKDKRGPGVEGDMPPDIAALLAKLDADGLGDLGDGDDDLGGLLEGMMGQLMTKQILLEPMTELVAKYPEYLANPPATVSPADLEKYRQQHEIVKQIVATFEKPGYSDETDNKEISRLVTEMQDLGGPPSEIVGDLPEGLDLGGGDDACTIM